MRRRVPKALDVWVVFFRWNRLQSIVNYILAIGCQTADRRLVQNRLTRPLPVCRLRCILLKFDYQTWLPVPQEAVGWRLWQGQQATDGGWKRSPGECFQQ